MAGGLHALIYHLPREPSRHRVAVWRKLQTLGALYLHDGATLLEELEKLERGGAELFDVAGARLSHHGDGCSFDTFLEEYKLGEPVLMEIVEIVHDADLIDEYIRAC